MHSCAARRSYSYTSKVVNQSPYPYLCTMFPKLTGNGRVWIYVSKRALQTEEITAIKQKLAVFGSTWEAHGKPLQSAFDVLYNQILVLAVDEEVESATGCSIDKALAVFQEIESTYSLDLFNRMNLTFVKPDETLRLVAMNEINQAYLSGLINNDTVFLDNTLAKLSDIRTRWQVPFQSSWAFRKIKTTAAS